MSELISGKKAFDAWIDGLDVYLIYKDQHTKIDADTPLDVFLTSHGFYIKPRTITINGIEVPAPFDGILKHKQYAYVLNTVSPDGYSSIKFYEGGNQPLICWTDEEKIKQVFAALRSAFGKK